MYYKTFDTHKYIKSLKETGFNEQQAEMLVKSLLESRDFDLSILATREQVAEVKSDFQKEITITREQVAEVKSDLQKKIAEVKSDLQKEITITREQIAEVKSDLQKEIAATNDAIKQSKVDTLKWTLPLIMTAISMIAVLMIKLF